MMYGGRGLWFLMLIVCLILVLPGLMISSVMKYAKYTLVMQLWIIEVVNQRSNLIFFSKLGASRLCVSSPSRDFPLNISIRPAQIALPRHCNTSRKHTSELRRYVHKADDSHARPHLLAIHNDCGRASFKRMRVCSTDAPERSEYIVKK
jgi:hypothetical protein